ncbi:TolB family protein [Nocardioides panaciterrulae]|uniref:WD40 repeat domain-containing protein n=1 Tax=Nocardioides panaciterrulae TaxID=661492 RepID=A0A7Y9E9E6_9ACTN|nr:PD40 domain-containing protein [Nocardioides panaciterrulae]NYD43631.1 hypothetical protein [Nocardioides panaciterrulae]
MTGRLREELARLGDTAPVAEIDPDTWARARRARIRDRALVLAAVVAVLVGVGTVPLALQHHTESPVAGQPAAGVPRHTWLVPDRMAARANDGSWTRDQVTSDLAVGRAAAAYVMDGGLPVVIGADDGGYHLLDLPGFAGNNELTAHGLQGGDLGLTLSPDGSKLAYTYARFGRHAADRPIPSGIRVVDLTNGDVRTVPIHGGEGTVVTDIRWSPSGTWLVWAGDQMASWTTMSMGGGSPVAGIVSPDGDSSTPLPAMTHNLRTSFAVSDTGEASVLGDSARYVGYGPGATEPSSGAAFSSSLTVHLPGRVPLHVGANVTLGAAYVGDVLHDLRVRDMNARYRLDTYDVDGRHQRVGLPSALDGAWVEPLGWIDATHLVARVGRGRDARSDSSLSSLALVTVGDHPSYRLVGGVDPGVTGLTLATDLMTPAQPTVDRPEPDWPWTSERWALTLGVPALALLLLLAGALLARRRDQR